MPGCTQLRVQTMYPAVARSSGSPELALEGAFQHYKTAAWSFPFLLAPAPGKAPIFASDFRATRGKPSIIPDLPGIYYLPSSLTAAAPGFLFSRLFHLGSQ